ncbi:MAG: hypothetical protein HDT39_01050 [Lachnospiraceae bacterium]|nr:hypothetical protein [Lachnospiraceae bacterium]
MSEGIQIYTYNNETIYQKIFFNMTKLNFMYDRRQLFRTKNNKLEYNNYFPFDLVKQKLEFYGLYLSFYATSDFTSMDYDFDIGLNNLQHNFEKQLVNCLNDKFKRIEIVIKIFNSRGNKSIIEKIEKSYNILFSYIGLHNTYIIKFENIEEIDFIQEYICGILLDENDIEMSFEQYSFNLADLKCIQGLTEQVKLLIFRVPLYANSNIMLYSKDKNWLI